MNWFDRLVGAVSPERAVRNHAARLAMVQMEHLHQRAAGGKRWGDNSPHGAAWGRNTGRVEDAVPRRQLNLARIRRLLATNPYAAKVRQTLLNNLIGYGITGTPAKGTPKKTSAAWNLWLRNADWMNRQDFYGLQDLMVGTMLGDGECFIVRRFDRSVPGVVPLRLQVLDAGLLDTGKAEGGIEYDADGRPTKYHFLARRPGNGVALFGQAISFEAKDVIHLFRQDWPGQTRGQSLFEPVIKRFEDMDEYIEAELVRKKIEACFAAFITPSTEYAAEQTDMGGQTDDLTDNGFEVEMFEPGMIERLRPGDQVTFGDPKPSAAIGEFSRVTLLGATTGAGVPYEHGTGDLSNVNYSSYRAGSLEFQRFCGRLQWLLIIPIALDRIWDWFLQDGYELGLFARRTYEIAWAPPAFESIDRVKDVKADILEMAAGLSSRRKLAGARGWYLDDLVKEIADDLAESEALGLQFQGDPRAGRNKLSDNPDGSQAANPPGNEGNDIDATDD